MDSLNGEMWKLAENIVLEMVEAGERQEDIVDTVLKTTHGMVTKDDITREISRLRHNERDG